MGGEKTNFLVDPEQGKKLSRTRAQRSAELHGPKPEDRVFASPKKMKRVPRSQGRERESSGHIEDEFREAFGFKLEVGVCFQDTAHPGEISEITRVFGNGDIEVEQTSSATGRNYTSKRTLSRAWLEEVIEEDAQGKKRFSPFEFGADDFAELVELEARVQEESRRNADQVTAEAAPVIPESPVPVPEEASGERSVPEVTAQGLVVESVDQLAGDPRGMTRPQPGVIKGALYGGKTGGENDVDSSTVSPPANPDEEAIDQQLRIGGDRQSNIGGRRRKGSSKKANNQLSGEIGETPVQPPGPLEASEVQNIDVQTNPTDNNSADTMTFEQAPSVAPKQIGEQSRVDAEPGVKTGVADAVLQADPGESLPNESAPAIVRTRDNPLHTVNSQPRASDDQYRDGSVWVEDYLKETDQQADEREALQREPAPAVVRTRNHPLRTENQKTQAEESDGDIENARMAVPGSVEEAEVFAAFGRGPHGEIGVTPEGQLRQRIDVATLACDQARLEYVTADNESRTVMSRLKGVLGISGKGIQNEIVKQKKEAYQDKLRELRDLRLEMVKMRYADQRESPVNLVADEEEESTPDLSGEESDLDGGEPISVAEDEHSLEKELESELRHFAMEVNIGLYNAWTELKSEQKGMLGKLKQFGTAYNQLSWQKKLVIGIPVAGLAVASGAGLLGTAMASAAIAAVLARRGIAAAGMFAATDGGLQKLAESRAQKMAEKIVANSQQEAKSLENLDQSDTNEAGMAGSEAQPSSEANEKSLDAKLERMKTFMDNHVIDSLDQALESRVRGHDRRRLGALAGSMGVAFGLPSFMASETGHELTRAAAEKAGRAASWVGETVFGDDYPPAKPENVPGDTSSALPSETSVEAKASAPATIERGASGSALESSSPAKGVELGGNISGILGKEITLVKGDSVWKLAGNMAKELGVKGDAESLYVTDALKDAYLAHGGNPNIQVGAVFDWKKYLSAEDIQKALQAANSLSAEQKASILANTEKNIVAAALTTEGPAPGVNEGSSLTEVAGVKSKNPDVLARARAQLAGTSFQTIPAGAGNGGGVQVPNMTTVTAAAGNYEISGVRPDQLVNTTESPSATGPVGGSGITVEQVAPSQNTLDAARRAGSGGVEGFLKVADTAWGGETPTVDLIAIEQVQPIVDKVPNMTCQEFFQVYLDAKDAVSNNYNQIDTLTFQGGLNWAEVDTFAQFINGFVDPNSGRKLIVQAVRANPNVTLKEFIEMYAPSVEAAPASAGGQVENVVLNRGSEPIGVTEIPVVAVAESTPSAPAESVASVSVVEPVLTEESARQGSSIATASSPEASILNAGEQSLVIPVDTGVVTAVNEGGIAITEEGTASGETLTFSQHVEPSRESFQQVRYEADSLPQQGGTGRGMSARAGMPPAGGFESNPRIPGTGPINLMELRFAEQRLQVGPAAKLTLRQLAESAKDPSKIPSGLTPEDIAKIKRLLVRVPGTSTGSFILKNGNTTVRQFIQDNIRARIPKPGSMSI